MSFAYSAKEFIRRYIAYLVIIIGSIFAIVFYHQSDLMIAILASSITLFVGLLHSKVENDKLFKELFLDYNNKYDTQFSNDLQLIINSSNSENNTITFSEHQKIIDYLNFCSEEYLWFREKRIPDGVWKAWFSGMRQYFKHPQIRGVIINEMSKNEDAYYGFFKYLKDEKIL